MDEDERSKAENSFQKRFQNRIWRLSHQYSGHFANALSLINISFGVFYAVYHWMWYIIWFSYLGFIIILYVVLEINTRYFNKHEKKKNRSASEDADYAEHMNNISLKEKPLVVKKHANDTFSDDGSKSTTRSATRYTKQSPITPPPPYCNRNDDTLKSNRSTNSSAKMSTSSKQAKLLEYSQGVSNLPSMKKNLKQSYSKQHLVEHLNTDDEQFSDDQAINNSRFVNNRTLQYSPKFKTSYESSMKY